FKATESPPPPSPRESKRTPSTEPDQSSLVPEENKDPVKQREAGASWQFVPGVGQNVAGFLEGLDHDGWNINFNWGATEAWVSDWKANNHNWVDAADIVYYKGHASLDSSVLLDAAAPSVTSSLGLRELAKAEDPNGDC